MGEVAQQASVSGRDLSPLLKPSSVAIVGSSARPAALGSRVLRNLAVIGYSGSVHVIHPGGHEIQGYACAPRLQSLGAAPDCVAIALSADKVLPILEEAAAIGVRAAVVFASGFAEAGTDGRRLQGDLAKFTARTGMLVCGPNVLGVRSPHERFALYSAPLSAEPVLGGVAVAAHSGSACIALSSTGRFGLSHVVSIGNAVALDAHDYLDYFVEDPRTKMACLFLETVRDPRALASAAARMREAGKPVVALKVGRTTRGAAASAAHTGSLATSHTAATEFFRSAGIVLVDDLDEMVETAVLMSRVRRKPPTSGLATINISGGEIALTCDLGEELGLEFAPLAEPTQQTLVSALPAFATAGNPLDATSSALADPGMYRALIQALVDDPGVGLLAISQDCPAGLSDEAAMNYSRLAKSAAEVIAKAEKPIVFYSNVGGALHGVTVQPLADIDAPVLQGARNTLVAVRSYLEWHRARALPGQLQASAVIPDTRWHARLASGTPLSEHEAKSFLADHGIRTTREELAVDAAYAVRAAKDIGFPVVAKIQSADIPHKTEVGGVMLNLAGPDEVEEAFRTILENVRHHAPEARVEGVVIQEMVKGGVEMIAGVSQFPPFGIGIVVGAGGVLVDVFKDSALGLVPVSPAAAAELVNRTRARALLDGFRGSPPGDRAAFESLVARLSDIAQAYAGVLQAIDLNPVVVLPDGQGVCVLDALVIPFRSPQPSSDHP